MRDEVVRVRACEHEHLARAVCLGTLNKGDDVTDEFGAEKVHRRRGDLRERERPVDVDGERLERPGIPCRGSSHGPALPSSVAKKRSCSQSRTAPTPHRRPRLEGPRRRCGRHARRSVVGKAFARSLNRSRNASESSTGIGLSGLTAMHPPSGDSNFPGLRGSSADPRTLPRNRRWGDPRVAKLAMASARRGQGARKSEAQGPRPRPAVTSEAAGGSKGTGVASSVGTVAPRRASRSPGRGRGAHCRLAFVCRPGVCRGCTTGTGGWRVVLVRRPPRSPS